MPPIRRAPSIVLLALLTLVLHPALAADMTGRVVGVHDGDTLTLLVAGDREIQIRLAEIDTPESRQPYGTKAKQALSTLAFGKRVRVVAVGTDRYGRTLGRVYVGATDANAALVRQGAAWVYRKYSHDPQLLDLERQAQAAKRGIWALPEAQRVPPWQWRQAAKAKGAGGKTGVGPAPASGAAVATGPAAGIPAPGGCGSKHRCNEMADCAEARHYLNDCGVRSLDKNGDGTPCESLCR